MSMSRLLDTLRGRFEALSLRERGMIALIPLLALGFLLLDDLHRTSKQRHQQALQVAELKSQAAHAQAALLQLQAAAKPAVSDPAQLKQQLQTDIADQLAGFISPEQMHEVLHAILAERYGVSVLALASRPAEPVAAAGPGKLYRHTLELTLSGDYFNIINYLNAVEKKAGIHWRKLDYQVQGWPKNTVQVEFFTLSLEEALIRA